MAQSFVILFIFFPFTLNAQINFDDLDLEAIELPSFNQIELPVMKKGSEQFAPIFKNFLEQEGGVHETFIRPDFSIPTPAEHEIIKWEKNIYPSKNESSYTLFGLGTGRIAYSGEGDDPRSKAQSNSTISLDIIGFYWPKFNHKFISGVLLNVLYDQLTLTNQVLKSWQVTTSLSFYYFFGKNIGSGFFLRSDFGFASIPFYIESSDESYSRINLWGGNWLFGLGYGFAFWEQTRILLGVNYAKAFASLSNMDKTNDIMTISLGGLF
jgi:hypothetical protein